MADELNTVDIQITDPSNPEAKIDNPDYVKPDEVVADPKAAKAELDLTPAAEPAAITVGKTGNVNIDAVGALLAERKVENADAIIAEYAKSGEVSLTAKADLVESLGEATAKMVIDQLHAETDKLVADNTKARTETLDYANKLFNGEDADTTWKQIQEFVKDPESGFTDADQSVLADMIRKGGYSARLAFDKIATVYNSDSNTTSEADLLSGDTLVQGSFTPITAKEYSAELSKLTAQHGYESAQVQQLQARRLRSRNQGIA